LISAGRNKGGCEVGSLGVCEFGGFIVVANCFAIFSPWLFYRETSYKDL